MIELITEIQIEASADKVWKTFIDFARYPEWNPFIPKIIGEPKKGVKLEVHLNMPNEKKEMVFKALVLNVEDNKELRWVGKMPLGLFKGERRFFIQAINEKQVRFIHSEKFTGILVVLVKKKINVNARQGFEKMNNALKTVCEK
jgi:hypothetical protein